MAPGKYDNDFQSVISIYMLRIEFMSISWLRGVIKSTFDDNSTLVQVMAWCRQAASHYLSQCWPKAMASYGITRPQWVNKEIFAQQKNLSVTQYLTVFILWAYNQSINVWCYQLPNKNSQTYLKVIFGSAASPAEVVYCLLGLMPQWNHRKSLSQSFYEVWKPQHWLQHLRIQRAVS